jgi:hypothetical protein
MINAYLIFSRKYLIFYYDDSALFRIFLLKRTIIWKNYDSKQCMYLRYEKS